MKTLPSSNLTTSSPETIQLKEVPCTNLSELEIIQIINLVSSWNIPDYYILSRVKIYDMVILYYKNEKLLAIQFLQSFNQEPNIFLYYGPAFARYNSFIPMFVQYLQKLFINQPDGKLVMLAEVQNPKMLMILHGLFGSFGYSCLSGFIHPEIIENVKVFCEQFSHIGQFNQLKFTTSSESSIYQERNDCSFLNAFLLQNQINLATGDNLLFAAIIPTGNMGKQMVLEQVFKGVISMADWSAYKEIFKSTLKTARF